jgi:hypothetical protein
MKKFILTCFVIFTICLADCQLLTDPIDIEEQSSGLYQIEGKVYPPEIGNENNWQDETQIILNSGKFSL